MKKCMSHRAAFVVFKQRFHIAMTLSYMFKDFENIENTKNKEDKMESTLLSSKGISSLRLQSLPCNIPPILCNAHLAFFFFFSVYFLTSTVWLAK